MNPKVSVIIPVYNNEGTLRRALNSVFRQTLDSMEIICIDDGSTDRSKRILEHLSRKHPSMHVIHQRNSGAGISRNNGISVASGEYIAFLDGDDTYPVHSSLDRMYSFAESNSLSICGGYREDIQGFRKIRMDLNREDCPPSSDGKIVDYNLRQYDYDFMNYIFKRKHLISNDIRFPPYSRYQDPIFFVKAMHAAGKYGVVPVTTYRYYRHETTWAENKVLDLIKGIRDVLEYSSSNGLEKLHNRTLYRLNREYYEVIKNNMNESIIHSLFECEKHINENLLEKVENPETEISILNEIHTRN